MDKMIIYNHLPIVGQNLACYVEGSRIKHNRYSDYFFSRLKEYEKHNTWSYDELCEYRDKKLQTIIRHCYNTVPYYKKLFSELGISPESIRTIDDLKVLPILTKDIVKENSNSLVSSAIPAKQTKVHSTGGTTGAGLRFITTNNEEAEQWAVWWRYRKLHGIEINTWCGNLGGKTTTPLSQSNPPYWRNNRPVRQVFYSGYHINERTAPFYADHIKKVGIQWLHGYPSNLANLATSLTKNNISVPMKWVSIGAENLYDSQISQIKKAFLVKPIQHYGLTEGVANISEWPDHKLTVDEDFCCIEFLPTENEYEYHIIGTTLTNFAMPLVRYDTGDLAIIKEIGQHSEHGRTVDKINGRENEYVLLPSGSKIGAAAISLIICDFPEIICSQILQKSINEVDICVQLNNHSVLDEERLIYKLRERFGNDIDIKIVRVDSLKKTKSGKQKLVISEM